MENIDLKKEYFFSGSSKGCLLIHGFSSTPAELRELGESLSKEGYTVLSILLSGHGTLVENMEKSNYGDWIKSAEEGYERLKKTCSKIYVIGHSMGGLLALNLAENYKVDKLVALAPALVSKSKAAKYAGIIKHFVKYTKWPPEQRPEEETKYLLGYAKIPLRSVEQLSKLQKVTIKDLKKIVSPLLIIQSIKDTAVHADGIKLIEKEVSSKEIQKFYLDNCGHNITIECEKGIVVKEVIAFLCK